jgi:hypothetical protein
MPLGVLEQDSKRVRQPGDVAHTADSTFPFDAGRASP